MKRLLIKRFSCTVLCVLSLSYLYAQKEWYKSDWSSRKIITIENSQEELTFYQVKITIDFEEGMQPDFEDIRFADSDGKTELIQWLDRKTNDKSADFWVEIPQVPANSKKNIYVYFGNPTTKSGTYIVSMTISGDQTYSHLSDRTVLTDINVNNYEKGNVVITCGKTGEWDNKIRVELGNMIYAPNNPIGGNYIMSYTGYTGKYVQGATKAGLAYSENGLEWKKYRGNPIFDTFFEDPYLIRHRDEYYLYGEDSPNDHIVLYRSKNLKEWQYDGIVLSGSKGGWDESWVGSPVVMAEGDKLYMFYEGVSKGIYPKSGMATSKDGLNWEKCTRGPLFERNGGIAGAEDIYKEDGVYYFLWSNGGRGAGLNLSISTDLVNWTHRCVFDNLTCVMLGKDSGHLFVSLRDEMGVFLAYPVCNPTSKVNSKTETK